MEQVKIKNKMKQVKKKNKMEQVKIKNKMKPVRIKNTMEEINIKNIMEQLQRWYNRKYVKIKIKRKQINEVMGGMRLGTSNYVEVS